MEGREGFWLEIEGKMVYRLEYMEDASLLASASVRGIRHPQISGKGV